MIGRCDMAYHPLPHEKLQEQLQSLSAEDLKEQLMNDPVVKAVLNAVPEQDRPRIEAFVLDFLDGWKTGAVDPIIAMASDPEFVKAFVKAMAERDPEAKDLGDLL